MSVSSCSRVCVRFPKIQTVLELGKTINFKLLNMKKTRFTETQSCQKRSRSTDGGLKAAETEHKKVYYFVH